MLNLTSDDKLILSDIDLFRVRNIELSSGSFYVKSCDEVEVFKELLGKKVFDIVGIKCPDYYYFKENRFLISEDLNKLKGFKYASKYHSLFNCVTLDKITDLFSNECNNKESIILEINIMHFIDILFSNTDRHTNNYGIYFDDEGNGFLAVFDNGLMLDYFNMPTKPMACFMDNVTSDYKKIECEFFINGLSDEHKQLIYHLFCKFNPNTINLLINQIERENNYKFKCKTRLLVSYIKNYMMVYGVISKCINRKTKREWTRKLSK